MKNLIILCILLLSQLCLHAANENPKRVEYEYFKEINYPTIWIIAYPQFDEDGKRVLTTFCLKKETTQDTLRYQYEKYDKNNLLTELRIDSVIDGAIKPAYKEEIEYNKSGKPITNKKWQLIDKTLTPISEILYFYNNDNRLDSVYHYSFKGAGLVKTIEVSQYYSKYIDTLVCQYYEQVWENNKVKQYVNLSEFKYDAKHRLISEQVFKIYKSNQPDGKQDSMFYKNIYTYEGDNIVEIEKNFYYNLQPMQTNIISMTYQANNVIRKQFFKFDENKNKYLYMYDTLIYQNDRLMSEIQYTINEENKPFKAKEIQYNYSKDELLEEKIQIQYNPSPYGHSARSSEKYFYYQRHLSGISTSEYDSYQSITLPAPLIHNLNNLFSITDLNNNEYIDLRIINHNNQSLTSVEIKYSDSSSVEDDNNEVLFSPNPIKDFININTDVNIDGMIEIYDASGAMLLQVNPSYRIDLRQLSSGFYFVKINGKSYKIVKE